MQPCMNSLCLACSVYLCISTPTAYKLSWSVGMCWVISTDQCSPNNKLYVYTYEMLVR